MDISKYLLPIITDQFDQRYSARYVREFANHYDIRQMQLDAAEATGVSYYRLVEGRVDLLPDEWRIALETAAAHNEAIDNPRDAAELEEAVTLMQQPEWTKATWSRLTKLGYADFSANEATADGAFWNTSYSLSPRGEELAQRLGVI